jgi:hypothetical protein
MMRLNAILSATGLVLALSLPSWAQVQTLPTQTVTISGTVATIAPTRDAGTGEGSLESTPGLLFSPVESTLW